MNEVCYFEIQAGDPEALAGFYGAAFGWRFDRVEGLRIPDWRITAHGRQHGGLLQRPAAPPPPQCGTHAFVCSIQVADFVAAAARIRALGGIEAMPKFAVPGCGWQGYFVDPAGNTFGVFQADTDAR